MVLLVDISSLGMSQVWNLRGYLQDFSKTLSTSFPEILDKVFIMGASGAFPTIWNLVKRWTDPETASKFVVLSSTEVLPTLRDRIDIENIPGKYGGRFKEEENQRPLPDGSVEQALEWMPGHGKTFPRGLLRWQLSPTEDMMKAVAATGDGGQLSVAHFANLCAGQNCQL
ncbi:CRAL-TRIO domain-containing protein [Pseudocercospora fuligena]|uniref:CRAL-TRIO domain-containing protein n=1 Tax=Pseudocercospora fuligena TaxID=685502 RepID=A0A8H6RBW0_9PEZI|nr:CRAL-TRIO domain-containing protein [Pseudocercospora fuligena]